MEREKFVVKAEKDDEQYQQWLAQEDDFMLVQAKKRAVIRVRGREKSIDALVINLNLIEGKKQRQRVLGDDEFGDDGGEFYITEPDELIKVLHLSNQGANKAVNFGGRNGRIATRH
jgi:Conserved mid region of cactin